MALKNMEHHSRVREANKICCCVPQMASSAQLFITALFSTFFWPGSLVHRAKKKNKRVKQQTLLGGLCVL